MQKLEGYDYLLPLAMKLTDNKTSDNVWIATSIFNDIVKKEILQRKICRYAGASISCQRDNKIGIPDYPNFVFVNRRRAVIVVIASVI